MLGAVRNAPSPALTLLIQHHSLDHSGMREQSVLAQKSWARCKQNQHRPVSCGICYHEDTLKSSVFKSASTPFVLELPEYRCPTLQSVGFLLIDRSRVFLRQAGTVMLASLCSCG